MTLNCENIVNRTQYLAVELKEASESVRFGRVGNKGSTWTFASNAISQNDFHTTCYFSMQATQSQAMINVANLFS